MGRALILSLVALLIVGVLPASAAPGAPGRNVAPGPAPQHDEDLSGAAFVAPLAQSRKNPTLASSLVGVGQQVRTAGRSAAMSQARSEGISVKDDRVHVEIQAAGENTAGAEAAVTRAGGMVERSVSGLVQAFVPPDGLEQVASDSAVRYVEPARRLFPTAVAGQEVAASGANGWQTSGAAGSGVKIAILDGDFQGYTSLQASGDLPPSLVTKNFCANFENGDDGGHGTAVAEIVYEMAPGAQLYLVCATTLADMASAVQYMIANGIQIVNHSRGIFNTERADGVFTTSAPSYLPESLITAAYNAGILWVNSAGNSARIHWSGAWRDDDNDGVLNFAATDEGNDVTVQGGTSISVSLKWDNWPTTTNDYDLYLVRASDGQVVALSTSDQTSGTRAPIEDLTYTNQGATASFFISVVKYSATTVPPRFDIFAQGTISALQYNNADGSLTDFGVSPRALVVGASCWQTPSTIEPFSSQGPTIAPTVTGNKPDITGLDSESSATFGAFSTCGGSSGFAGTSAASPQVAAAAALLRDTDPSLTTPDLLKTAVKAKATDAGAAGVDTVFGTGYLTLGTLSTPAVTCTSPPRGQISMSVSTTAVTGALTTFLAANGANNSLLKVVFGNGSRAPVNAVLSFADGRSLGSGSTLGTVYTPFGSTTAAFLTRRQSAGAATTVPFVVTDRCGTWSSFVGGGTGAGF